MPPRYLSYSQSTGEIRSHIDGVDALIGHGWAGCGEGKNNPTMQDVRSTGPLPRGMYSIGGPHEHPTVGPYALRLTPYPDNQMFGRDGFLIHGASKDPAKHGQESHGCIVTWRPVREKIHSLGIPLLVVTL